MEFRARLDRWLGNALVVIMGVMVLNVLWQVTSRYVVGHPSFFTDELARYLMIWLGLLGAAYVSGRNMHVAIDVISSNAGDKTKKRLSVIVNVIIILFALLALIVGGSRLVYITWVLEQTSPALQLPLAVVYIVLPVSGLLIIYYKVSDIIKG